MIKVSREMATLALQKTNKYNLGKILFYLLVPMFVLLCFVNVHFPTKTNPSISMPIGQNI